MTAQKSRQRCCANSIPNQSKYRPIADWKAMLVSVNDSTILGFLSSHCSIRFFVKGILSGAHQIGLPQAELRELFGPVTVRPEIQLID